MWQPPQLYFSSTCRPAISAALRSLGLIDVFRLRRIGHQAQHERDDRLPLFRVERELRHPQPLVVPLVLGLLEVVAPRLLQLLIDEADAIAGLQRVVVDSSCSPRQLRPCRRGAVGVLLRGRRIGACLPRSHRASLVAAWPSPCAHGRRGRAPM